ncbi:MAG: FHA domain-containing protein [Planctomycetaceae bacterium]
MSEITIRVLEGDQRGRVYARLVPPLTIGREEDNSIQLNDERVSRFHLKIQEDDGRLILTDLDSTNGTKINGHPVQMRVLQPGDLVTLGRAVLLIGSDEEIRRGQKPLRPSAGPGPADEELPIGHGTVRDLIEAIPGDEFLPAPGAARGAEGAEAPLFRGGPPPLPEGLRVGQLACLSDVLSHLHHEIAQVCDETSEDRQAAQAEVRCPRATWHRLLVLQSQLATYLKQISDPPGAD